MDEFNSKIVVSTLGQVVKILESHNIKYIFLGFVIVAAINEKLHRITHSSLLNVGFFYGTWQQDGSFFSRLDILYFYAFIKYNWKFKSKNGSGLRSLEVGKKLDFI